MLHVHVLYLRVPFYMCKSDVTPDLPCSSSMICTQTGEPFWCSSFIDSASNWYNSLVRLLSTCCIWRSESRLIQGQLMYSLPSESWVGNILAHAVGCYATSAIKQRCFWTSEEGCLFGVIIQAILCHKWLILVCVNKHAGKQFCEMKAKLHAWNINSMLSV